VISAFFHVKLGNRLGNWPLADSLSRKCSKALIYKALCCNGHLRNGVKQRWEANP
jgi:hypothetical protein